MDGIIRLERRTQAEHLVEHGRNRVLIRTLVCFIAHLLRRHVAQRAHDEPGARQRRRGCHLGNTEIDDLGDTAGLDQDIRRFDVTVNHALCVRVTQGIAETNGNRELSFDRRLEAIGDVLFKTLPVEEFHHEEPTALVLPDVVDRNNVWMAQTGAGFGLVEKPRGHI